MRDFPTTLNTVREKYRVAIVILLSFGFGYVSSLISKIHRDSYTRSKISEVLRIGTNLDIETRAVRATDALRYWGASSTIDEHGDKIYIKLSSPLDFRGVTHFSIDSSGTLELLHSDRQE